jgi:hypothetical protein
MSTLIRTETGKDARGNKYLTNVYQDFASMTPDTGATSYTLTQEDGVYTLTETFTEEVPDPGGGGGGQVYPDIWSLDISTITEPIETFLLFRAGISAQEMGQWTAWKAGKEPGTDTYPSGFPANSSNNYVQQLLLRFNRGEVDYLTPRIVVRHQKVFVVPPNLGGVGYASNDISGCPFTFSNQVNFLFTGATCVQEGSTFRVSREWLTSKPGKWDSYIYGP